MKKRLSILLSILLISIFAFNSIGFSATPETYALPAKASTGISKEIVEKAKNGDLVALKAIEDRSRVILEKAKNGDEQANKILQDLDCFNEDKVNAKIPKEGLKLRPGESVTHYFDDGSAVKYEVIGSVQNDKDVSSAAIFGVTKNWIFGIVNASLTTNVDNSGSTRYVCHIANVWPTYWSTASTISDPSSSIVYNDQQPAYCQSSATLVALYGTASWSLYMYVGVDSGGFAYIVHSSP